ncbi:hypothetical protein PTSG_12930 [Salpingoeca rosetta]|uniref:Uncharacterized protein n=1 Tax=Salpingoeca rosetta (strain ATCC 50818 / BSB-021) TaxID=946362 RepID=F2UP62_SALR5|nr:uncharacterized protein PTSG_12930 [Salpingoeca rosetta]EGD79417.1 hypothetical protein PTSG_12930 [Salpingoeca rosetta]|eukprot:XP_004989186.1 hypothetical protein PTSG_12930 [Salpingoeca rosetta]
MKLDHAEVCDSTRTGRHDYMQNAIARAFMQLNRRATQEPSGFPGAGGKRGDILSFDKSGDYTVFDLVFAAPAASSYQPQAAKVNLYAASQAEQRKIKKYQATLRDQGDFKFVPIAIEAGSGAWGSKFRKFFSSDLMSTTDPQTPPHVRTFTSMHSSTYWRQVLSIARCKAECYANLRCIGQMPHDKRGKNQPGSSTQTVQRARAQAQRNHQQGKRTRKRKHPQTTPPGHSGQRSNDSNNGTAATAAATATTDNDEGQPRSAPVTSRSPGGPAATEPPATV